MGICLGLSTHSLLILKLLTRTSTRIYNLAALSFGLITQCKNPNTPSVNGLTALTYLSSLGFLPFLPLPVSLIVRHPLDGANNQIVIVRAPLMT